MKLLIGTVLLLAASGLAAQTAFTGVWVDDISTTNRTDIRIPASGTFTGSLDEAPKVIRSERLSANESAQLEAALSTLSQCQELARRAQAQWDEVYARILAVHASAEERKRSAIDDAVVTVYETEVEIEFD